MHELRPEQEFVQDIDIRDIVNAAFTVDEAHRIVAWNSSAEQLLGYAAADVLGRPCDQVICREHAPHHSVCHSHCARLGNRGRHLVPIVEILACSSNGSLRRLKMNIVYAHSPQGRPRTLHILVDPLERHALAEGDGTQAGDTSAGSLNREGPTSLTSVDDERAKRLTVRELEVLSLLARGLAPKDIASVLSISQLTVRNHVTRAMEKLDVTSRLHAVVAASRLGLI